MDTHKYDIQVRALVYEEGGEFVARSLEMDLIGCSSTPAKALKELQGMVEAQVSFATFKNDPSLILHKADQEYFDRWEQASAASLRNELFPDKAVHMKYVAHCITITKSELSKLKKPRQFDRIPEPELAEA